MCYKLQLLVEVPPPEHLTRTVSSDKNTDYVANYSCVLCDKQFL